VFDYPADCDVDDVVVAGFAGGGIGEVESAVGVELIEAIDGVFGEVEGSADGFAIETTGFGEFVFVYVGFDFDRAKVEHYIRGAFFGGFVVGRGANDEKIGACGEGFRASDFGGALVQNR